jgi:hypothetical protein
MIMNDPDAGAGSADGSVSDRGSFSDEGSDPAALVMWELEFGLFAGDDGSDQPDDQARS